MKNINTNFKILINSAGDYLNKLPVGRDGSLYSSNEFKLFYYIRENFISNYNFLLNCDLDFDTMGFLPVKRNIRISSEALLDLYNLTFVPNYWFLLNHLNDPKTLVPPQFERFCRSGTQQFGFRSKYECAKNAGFGGVLTFLFADGNSFLHEANAAIHASIFITPNDFDNQQKLSLRRQLLMWDVEIFKEGFKILCSKFGENFMYTPKYVLILQMCDSFATAVANMDNNTTENPGTFFRSFTL